MAEYIDRDRFVMETQRRICANCDKRKGMKNGKYRVIYDIGDAPCRACGVDDMISEVEDFPAADVQPVKHGEWTAEGNDEYGNYWDECTACRKAVFFPPSVKNDYKYCPHCGALMGDEDDV